MLASRAGENKVTRSLCQRNWAAISGLPPDEANPFAEGLYRAKRLKVMLVRSPYYLKSIGFFSHDHWTQAAAARNNVLRYLRQESSQQGRHDDGDGRDQGIRPEL
jgi:hypothetical protein